MVNEQVVEHGQGAECTGSDLIVRAKALVLRSSFKSVVIRIGKLLDAAFLAASSIGLDHGGQVSSFP